MVTLRKMKASFPYGLKVIGISAIVTCAVLQFGSDSFTLSYDPGGRVTSISTPTQSAAYTYNDNGELTSATLTNANPDPITYHEITATSLPAVGGSISGAGTYRAGDIVEITATAQPGFEFEKWSGSGIDGSNETALPLLVPIDGDKTIIAHFRVADVPSPFSDYITGLYPDSFDPELFLPGNDNDHDKWSNYEEFLMGFLANDPNSGFRLRIAGLQGSLLTFEYNRVRPTGTYYLKRSTNLIDWSTVDTLTPTEAAESFSFDFDEDSLSHGAQFGVEFVPTE